MNKDTEFETIASIVDKTFEIVTEFCKKFKNGFAYWSFGFFIYHIYSADSFEVIFIFSLKKKGKNIIEKKCHCIYILMVTENCDKSQAHRKKFFIQISTDIIGTRIIDKHRCKVVCTTKTINAGISFQYFEWIPINFQVYRRFLNLCPFN